MAFMEQVPEKSFKELFSAGLDAPVQDAVVPWLLYALRDTTPSQGDEEMQRKIYHFRVQTTSPHTEYIDKLFQLPGYDPTDNPDLYPIDDTSKVGGLFTGASPAEISLERHRNFQLRKHALIRPLQDEIRRLGPEKWVEAAQAKGYKGNDPWQAHHCLITEGCKEIQEDERKKSEAMRNPGPMEPEWDSI